MKEHVKALTESTLIPLSLVVGIVSIVWVAGHVSFQAEANAKAIDDLQRRQDSISQIQTDIAVIKTKVEAIEKNLKE